MSFSILFLIFICSFFFFFQAEDGIRDDLVIGVQTCALPISADCDSVDEKSSQRIVLSVCFCLAKARSAQRRREDEEPGVVLFIQSLGAAGHGTLCSFRAISAGNSRRIAGSSFQAVP